MKPAKTWAIIPVKELTHAKQRLASALTPSIRKRLVLTMLEDVLNTVGGVETIDPVIVVTADSLVANLAQNLGATVLNEGRAQGLNAAVTFGVGYAHACGAAKALVLPADVPHATPDELRRVVETGSGKPRSRAVIVPSADGDGTNALMLEPPGALEPRFGHGSFVEHLSQAVARRLDVQVLHLPGLAADIDELPDVQSLLDRRPQYAFLTLHMVHARQYAPKVEER